jgi:hypothetical protein
MDAALVTCSYRPDYEKCVDLCRSVDRFADNAIKHVLIVPNRDRATFAHLKSARRTILTAEDIIGKYFRYVPLHPKLWISRDMRIVRGWLIQQLLKLGVSDFCDADLMIHADSDVCFVRDFSIDRVVSNGRVKLFVEPGGGQLPTHIRWHRAASKLLGIPERDYHGADYIHQLVSWHRPTVQAMLARMSEVAGKPWQMAIVDSHHFAEYILYGVYVEHMLKDTLVHVPDLEERCLCSWAFNINNPTGLNNFLSGLKPNHAAVLIQSTEQLSTDHRRSMVSAITTRHLAFN